MEDLYIGKKEKHIVFGEGSIVELTEELITVQFLDGSEKRFPRNQFKMMFQDVTSSENDKKSVFKMFFGRQDSRTWKAEEESGNSFAGGDEATWDEDSFEEFFDKYNSALKREIAYIKTVGGKRQKAFEGKLIEISRDGCYSYSFEIDEEMNFPEGTQLTVWYAEKKIGGTVIDCDDFTLSFYCQESMGDTVEMIEFEAASWRLLDTLRTRINELRENPSRIVRELVTGGKRAIDYANALKTGQDTGIAMAMNEPITFIWGPPGTGKTQTLAEIALRHIAAGHRTLMVSYSNVSVDGAVLRLLKLKPDLQPGIALRYGYPKVEAIKDHEYLTSYSYVLRNHPELVKERKELIDARKHVKRQSKEHIRIAKRLSEIKNALREEEHIAVKEASFIATTISKAEVDSTIYKDSFDVVIIDEASMAYVPQVVFSAGLAKEHFICMGDFEQLPPIVQSGDGSVLNRDIFDYCYITKAIEGGDNHKWLCMLDTQYRMDPEIADFASKHIYNGLLKTGRGIAEQRKDIRNDTPFTKKPMNAVDLTGVMSVCTQTGDGSRINILSALIAMSFALMGAGKHEVGIITPYHAQSHILYAMSRDIKEAGLKLHSISCATVHQFQGSEKDIILYDAVDCYRMKYPSIMLTSTKYNYANRLFNVALTRAKGKFVSFENGTFLRNKNLKQQLMFRKLMDAYEEKTPRISAVLDSLEIPKNEILTFFREKGQAEYLEDITKAKTEIHIDIGGNVFDNQALEQVEKALLKERQKGIAVYVRAEEPERLPKELKGMTNEHFNAVNPITIIDKEIIWFGMPVSKADFIVEGKVMPSVYRPVFRFKGAKTAKVLIGFLRMNEKKKQYKNDIE